MAVLKFKNPKYTGLDDEPKYKSISLQSVKVSEIYIGDSQPSGDEILWINTVDSSIKYKNEGEWLTISSEVDLSEYLSRTEASNTYQIKGDYATIAQLNTKSDKLLVENGGSGTVTKQLNPNIYYEFGECTSLTITLSPEIEGIYNEYMFEFASGSTATQLSLPESIKWIDDEVPVIEPSKTYQVSIVNNLALVGSF